MTKGSVWRHLDTLLDRYPVLRSAESSIRAAYSLLESCYEMDGKLLIAGNGGSAADAEHIAGELMKGFEKGRRLSGRERGTLLAVDQKFGPVLAELLQGALPAIALDGHFALTTAILNDNHPLLCFAQQVYGYGREGDVFLAISTSGESENILYAAVAAKARGMGVIGLTGERWSSLASIADVCIRVPAERCFMVQELHLPVYHCLCLMLEERFFE